MLTQEQYEIERAAVDKAAAYWNAHATKSKSGWQSLSKELAAHPDYAAVDNAMRGRVEKFEIIRDKPEKLFAYASFHEREIASRYSDIKRTGKPQVGDQARVTVWTGDQLGLGRVNKVYRSNLGDWRASIRVVIGGATYSGTAYLSAGDYVRLRRVKG